MSENWRVMIECDQRERDRLGGRMRLQITNFFIDLNRMDTP